VNRGIGEAEEKMAVVVESDRGFYLRELKSEQCLCERRKKRGHSFCYRCFKELPGDVQDALYNVIGFGYEEAFDEATTYLQRHVW